MSGRSGTTVVVTGASSFIGCRLAVRLAQRYGRVVAVVSGDPDGYEPLRRSRLTAVCAAGAELKKLNLEDAASVRGWVQEVRPAIWVQHAGWAREYGSLYRYDLARGHAVNVEPLGPLYASLAEAGCEGVLITGSSAEYGDTEKACLEEDACWPSTPYGLSKLAETVRARQLAQQYGLPTRTARVFLPFGPLDAPTKLLPSAAGALLRREAVELSPCGQYRDFVHVDDLAAGYDALIGDLRKRRHQLFDIFNLCGGRPVRLRELLLELAARVGADPALLRFGARPMRAGEAQFSFGSNDKAAMLLGWRPRELAEAAEAYIAELRAEGGCRL